MVPELSGQLKKNNKSKGFQFRNERATLEYLLSNVYNGLHLNASLHFTISRTVFIDTHLR